MMTLAKVASDNAAASYYENKDDYYSEGGCAPSRWWGIGASRLGLAGAVDATVFRDALDGQLPNGATIHHGGSGGRRGATDATFSAPKSLSLQAQIGGDTRLLDAHQQAMETALQYLQSLAAYRVTEDGLTRTERSDNVVVALFNHDLSRATDPHTHSHAVILNATARPDNTWRALELTKISQQQKLVGALYRTELAQQVQALGYAIRLTHTDGRFELSHINDHQINAFSQRSQMIEQSLAKRGKTRDNASARERQIATLVTREKKTEVDREVLRETWLQKSHELGIDYAPALAAEKVTFNHVHAAHNAVDYAVAHHTEREAVVSEVQLMQAALEHGTGKTDLGAIRDAMYQWVEQGQLIQDGDRYTTPEAQARERDMLAVEFRGRGAVVPVMSEDDANNKMEKYAAQSLNAGQTAAAQLILSSDSRFIAINGSAGTGKSTLLQAAQGFANERGFTFIGATPSAAAARELSDKGIASETLARLAMEDYQRLNEKMILLIDEAGMASTKQIHELMRAVEAANGRAVFIGDVAQLKAIEAGRGFAQLQEAGIARVELGEIQRQHDRQLLESVALASKGQVRESLNVIRKHVNEIAYSDDRYSAIAKEYVLLPETDREKTAVVAGTRYARDAINTQVRQELGLAGTGTMVITMVRKDLTEAQRQMSRSYQIGDRVQAMKHYKRLGMKSKDQAHVVAIAPGSVTLERSDGEQVNWQPSIETNVVLAYEEKTREFTVGDQVRVTANDYRLGVVNGDQGKVIATHEETQSLIVKRAKDDKEFTLKTDKALHLDHAYCSTVFVSQGASVDRVLIDADTRSVTSHEASYYVAISRAVYTATIFTDDKDMLPEAMTRENEKSAALDIAYKGTDYGL